MDLIGVVWRKVDISRIGRLKVHERVPISDDDDDDDHSFSSLFNPFLQCIMQTLVTLSGCSSMFSMMMCTFEKVAASYGYLVLNR